MMLNSGASYQAKVQYHSDRQRCPSSSEHQTTSEFVNFVVADFDGTYHAILGRPSLTKFMAVPHYSYLVLKMPTEKGVLTVRGNVHTAYTCEEESFKITEAIDLSIRMAETVAQAT